MTLETLYLGEEKKWGIIDMRMTSDENRTLLMRINWKKELELSLLNSS
jgi:hypothetical protein